METGVALLQSKFKVNGGETMINRVKKIRKDKDLSQFELSKKSNITQSDISQIENGKIFPYPGWRKRLSEALKVPEVELFPEIEKEA